MEVIGHRDPISHGKFVFSAFLFIPFHLEFVFFVCLSSIIWYSFLACVFSYGFQSLFCS